MKPHIVADGNLRLRQDKKFQARLQELSKSIRARHAAELAKAGFFRRLVLRWRIAAEVRKEQRKLKPSPHSFYSSRIVSRL
jgi:hypothetical protein